MKSQAKVNSVGFVKVGDKLMIECNSAMGTGGPEIVTRIKTKYNRDTGKPYKVICCEKHKFYARSGRAKTPPTEYHISGKL